MTNDVAGVLIHELLKEKKFDAINKTAHILYPDKKDINISFFEESDIDGVRLMCEENNIIFMCSPTISEDEQQGIVNAISSGSIYNDSDEVSNTAKYIQIATLPNHALVNHDCDSPDCMGTAIMPVISKMDKCGRFNCDDADVTNGTNCLRDLCHTSTHDEVRDVMDNYLASHKQCCDEEDDKVECPEDAEKEHNTLKLTIIPIKGISDSANNIKTLMMDDCVSCESWSYVDLGGDEESIQEGSVIKRPKKLKPIDYDLMMSRINDNMKNVKTNHDKHILSKFIGNKLETIDFYCEMVASNNENYIVPDNIDTLNEIKDKLNKSLTDLFNIRNIKKPYRIWNA